MPNLNKREKKYTGEKKKRTDIKDLWDNRNDLTIMSLEFWRERRKEAGFKKC